MPNSLGGYDLTWFANEALIHLMKALGFGSRVHRGYDPSPQERGSTITISGPSGFTAQDAPSDAQDLDGRKVSVTLDNHREVKFGLTDKDLNASEDRIIDDHIKPACYALANDVDAALAGLYAKVPYAVDVEDGKMMEAIAAGRRILRQNGVPLTDGNVRLAVDALLEEQLVTSPFMYSSGQADGQNTATLIEGSLGKRFGVEMFPDGNIREHVSGTVVSAGTDAVGALNGAAAKGATSISIDGLSGVETLKAGDSFVIAGSSERYVVTADLALAAGANAAVPIFPALAQAYADNAVVTFEDGSQAGVHADRFAANLLFHRNFATLATAPLEGQLGTELARSQGFDVEVLTDDETGISLRAMRWYDPGVRKTLVAIDILWGYALLDPRLAVRLRRDA